MIVGACLARNEADRYLPRCLDNAASFCDTLVLVDDHSTDGTVDCARRAGAHVYPLGDDDDGGWWGDDETTPRAYLWAQAAAHAGPGGWIYIFDADHELIDIGPEDVRVLCQADHVNAWSWVLYDCWDSEETLRVDGYWQAHTRPRPWLFRAFPSPTFTPAWGPPGGIHVGHLPSNYPLHAAVAPGAIRHLGYVQRGDRERKHARYMALA